MEIPSTTMERERDPNKSLGARAQGAQHSPKDERCLPHFPPTSANLEVTLLWNRRSPRVWISIYNVANDEQAAAPVPHEQALDAFEHPYAYVAA